MQDKKYAALKEQVNVLLTTSSAPPPLAAASSATTLVATSTGGSGQLSESDVDARIERIVAATVAKAIREEEQKRETQAKTLTEALAAERAIRSKLLSRIAKLEQQQHSGKALGSAPGTPRRPGSPAPPSTGGAVAAVTQVRSELRKLQERLDSLQTQVAAKRVDGATQELESNVGNVKSNVEELSKRVTELERGDANSQSNAAQKYQLLEQKINAQQKQLLVLKTAGGNTSANNAPTSTQVGTL